MLKMLLLLQSITEEYVTHDLVALVHLRFLERFSWQKDLTIHPTYEQISDLEELENSGKIRVLSEKMKGFEIYNDEPDCAKTAAVCPTPVMFGDSKDVKHLHLNDITSRASMSTAAKFISIEPVRCPKSSQRGIFDTSPRIRARDETIRQNSELRWDSSYKETWRRNIDGPWEQTTVSTTQPETRSSTHKSGINTRRGAEIFVNRSGNIKVERLDKRTIMPPTNASKRAPLKPRLHILQDSTQTRDRPGSGPGKENLNSRRGAIASHKDRDHYLDAVKKERGSEQETKRSCERLTTIDSTQSLEDHSRRTSPAASFSYNSKLRSEHPGYMNTATKRLANHQRIIRESFVQHRLCSKQVQEYSIRQPLNRITVGFRTPRTMKNVINPKIQYPLIREDISQPQMFGDGWLDDMESVILQLANSVFDLKDQRCLSWDSGQEGMRQSLLRLYQDQTSVLLHQKLKVSLEQGILSIPQECVQKSSMIRTDIGLQRRFIHIWTESYNVSILRLAAEVVIGREISDRSNIPMSSPQTDPIGRRQVKKLVGNFINSCLLHNEDASPAEAERFEMSSVQYSVWSWRRTMLRSLMLVYLLDRSKEVGLFSSNLFLASSTFKSSSAILKEISALMISFLGDINRPLARLGYHGRHIQAAFDEYKYNINNLAVDFRDGVRLARLVELFIYSTDSEPMNGDAKPTFRREALINSAESQKPWILSQRLRYPCPVRSQKIYNVQIALSALRGLNYAGTIADSMKAEDIVDGHREKTVLMLWSIVGRLGLELLIDFSDLQKETRRFQSRLKCSLGQGDIGNQEDDKIPVEAFKRQKILLMAWAKSIAELHDLNIRDFTSFGDGAIFHKILDEYMPYIPCMSPLRRGPVQKADKLEEKLTLLGCNVYFGMFSNNFLMASLDIDIFQRRLLEDMKGSMCSATILP